MPTVPDLDQIIIFDTTMRDGEQSPGAAMNLEEKVRIAKTLEDMGVDVMEAGFPISSRGDFEAVQAIARTITRSTVCALSRATIGDIDAAAEAIRSAPLRRIHTFISTSPLHMKYKLQMEPDDVYDAVIRSVAYARRFTDDVEWSCEDGSRSEHDFLCRCIEAAINAGATTINVPDTVGYAVPEAYAALITMIRNRVPNIDKAVISVHCHNDLGLAVANSLAAVEAGARQIECTVNGIGERAGNAAIEEIVMALKTRRDVLPYTTGIRTEKIIRASRLVSAITGMVVQPNKAIVGANAFAHESGIHQDGFLKHAATYEIMTPESVGHTTSTITLGKLSGRNAFRQKLKELGYELGDNAVADAFRRFKDLADRKKEVFDEDIVAIVDDMRVRVTEHVKLVSLQTVSGTGQPWATLVLNVDGDVRACQETGDGPVDAAFRGIKNLVPTGARLKLYQVHAITGGTDAQAEVTVRLEENKRTYNGQGTDTDTIVASVKAYLNALNKQLTQQESRNS